MIFLFTDFSTRDPYVGQMHAVIRRRADVPVIDLLHHVPNHDMRAGAYLLDALRHGCSPGDVFVCVVDPGVGGARVPVMVKADGKWYVGPDNGLFEMVRRRSRSVEVFRIDWRPQSLSASFHGRDLFSPVGAMLAVGELPLSSPWALRNVGGWPEDLNEIIYIDHFGNAITGYRAGPVSDGALVRIKDRRLARGETFSSVSAGEALWYRNSMGLLEIAVREGSAADLLGLAIGDSFDITDYQALVTEPSY
jgi:S-adenosylmethionine hydrolase